MGLDVATASVLSFGLLSYLFLIFAPNNSKNEHLPLYQCVILGPCLTTVSSAVVFITVGCLAPADFLNNKPACISIFLFWHATHNYDYCF